jgi:hypothetical protein
MAPGYHSGLQAGPATRDERTCSVAKSLLLFTLAAVAEIGGAWLVWQGVREHRGLLWIAAGAVIMYGPRGDLGRGGRMSGFPVGGIGPREFGEQLLPQGRDGIGCVVPRRPYGGQPHPLP